jgi:hypothetical protein
LLAFFCCLPFVPSTAGVALALAWPAAIKGCRKSKKSLRAPCESSGRGLLSEMVESNYLGRGVVEVAPAKTV